MYAVWMTILSHMICIYSTEPIHKSEEETVETGAKHPWYPPGSFLTPVYPEDINNGVYSQQYNNSPYDTLPANYNDIVITKNVTDDLNDANKSVYVSTPGAQVVHSIVTSGYKPIDQQINDADENALKAKAESADAALKAQLLLLYKKKAEIDFNNKKAEELRRKRQHIIAKSLQEPKILAKETIPVAMVDNNNLSFKHHQELLNKRLEMIKNDQQNAIDAAKKYARLHVVLDNNKPKSLLLTNPSLYKDFVNNGPSESLKFDVPVNPAFGKYYVGKDGVNVSPFQYNDIVAQNKLYNVPYSLLSDSANSNNVTTNSPYYTIEDEEEEETKKH